jgi:hypothetical protein
VHGLEHRPVRRDALEVGELKANRALRMRCAGGSLNQRWSSREFFQTLLKVLKTFSTAREPDVESGNVPQVRRRSVNRTPSG